MAFTALLDACVLYPAPLRDLLIRLGLAGIYRPRWTEEIHDEWIRNLLERRPELSDHLQRTRTLMNEAIPDCLVTGYETLITGIELPDPNDRHVLAAAIVGRADVIVTFNLTDFLKHRLEPFRIEARHPDEFIRHAIDFAEAAALSAIKQHRAALKNPPKSASEYIETVSTQGLPTSANALKRWVILI